jgi:hypothetical protein
MEQLEDSIMGALDTLMLKARVESRKHYFNK